jgi:hypothetical protein
MIALPDASAIGAAHRRRLRALWRSAGWPSHDMLELELLAAGLVVRHMDAQGRETLRVTDAGVALLADTLQRNRARRDAHEALVVRVATEMQRAGRIAWRGLALRAPLADVVAGPDGATAPKTRWALAMPDVFSVRHTTAEALLWPVVHEVKVTRADLLGDLKRPAKGEAYRAVASECWYVLRAGIGEPEEIPEVYGVMCAHPVVGAGAGAGEPHVFGALEVLRPAPRRPFSLPFDVWMALARATPEPFDDSDAQALLGDDALPPDQE